MKIPRTKQERRFAFGFIMVVAIIMIFLTFHDESFHYLDHVHETLVTVDGKDLTLHDLGFYILYEETIGNRMAETYDAEKPTDFWGKHTNGVFISGHARRSALDMMIHDEIFYEMAMASHIELTEDDLLILEERFQDFLATITIEQLKAVGMTEDDLYQTLAKMAVAEKYMIQYADENSVYYEEYNITGDTYQSLLAEHTVKENTYLINQLNVGRISINQK